MSLPNQLMASRMTNATVGDAIDDNVGALETALCDILGIAIDTPVNVSVLGQVAKSVNVRVLSTPGTTTWARPNNLVYARVVAIGGGGGGGSPTFAAVTFRAGGGGGGGGYAESWVVPVAVGNSTTVIVGAGGTGGNTTSGGSGGTTNFGNLVIATGGTGGNGGTVAFADAVPTSGGLGGVGTTGRILLGGSDGGHGLATSTWMVGGPGGDSILGGGGGGALLRVPTVRTVNSTEEEGEGERVFPQAALSAERVVRVSVLFGST